MLFRSEWWSGPLVLSVPRDEVTYMVMGRAISAFFGTAAIPVTFLIARRLSNATGGVMAALLLAGSVIHMDAAVRNTAALLDGPDPLERAAAMASTGPCRVLGLADRGVLAEGSRADLVALDADSGARRGVWLAGRRIV